MKFRLSLIFVVILLILPLVFSADGYTILTGSSEIIDEHGFCKDVSYDGSETSIFVPTKTAEEWYTGGDSFYENPPPGVSFDDCFECVVDGDCDGGYLCVMNKCRTINPHEVDCFWAANKSICETNLLWSDGKSNEHEEQHEAAFIVGGCDDNDETVLDTFTNTCYTRDWNLPGGILNWQNAMNFCENLALCDDGTWDGNHTTEGTCSGKTIEKNDWVLPTKREILRALDHDRTTAPIIVGGNNNIFNNVQDLVYWSSNKRTASEAWRVDVYLIFGHVFSGYVNVTIGRVVCVSRNE